MRKWLIVPDAHIPYHDERAWRLLLKVGRLWTPYGIIVLGDFGEFRPVSRHRKNPQAVNRLALETTCVAHARADLDSLRAKRKIFITGNHEQWLWNYIADNAPALDGLVNLDDVLGLSQNKWEIVQYRDAIKVADTTFTHDLERSGKNAAHQAAAECGGKIVIGHLHRFDQLLEGTSDGGVRGAVCPGWLGDWRQQEYKHRVKARRDWQLGFALGYEHGDRMTTVPVAIDDYSCLIEGKLIRG